MPTDTLGLVKDPEFSTLLPSLTDDELRQLKDNVLADGAFLETIKVWRTNGHRVIFDGNNRYDVWIELDEDTEIEPPEIEEWSFHNRDEVLDWIVTHQLGRRNLTSNQRAMLIGKKFNQLKNSHGGDRTSSDSRAKPQSEALLKTAEKVAKTLGVSRSTVERSGPYNEAVERIRNVNSKAAADILSNRLAISQKDVIALSKADDIGRCLANVRHGRKWNENDEPEEQIAAGDVIEAATEMRGVVQSIGRIITQVEAVKPKPGAEFLADSEAVRHLKNAQECLKVACYHCDCPRCKTDTKHDCKLCAGTGWVPAGRKHLLSDKDRG